MATEKQIAANRANAQLSTGPKTLAGRLKSSRNAFRHGLSSALPLDPEMSAQIDVFAQTLAGEKPSEDRLTSAAEFAQTQQLLRIRSTRLLAEIELFKDNTQELHRLAALDRYER